MKIIEGNDFNYYLTTIKNPLANANGFKYKNEL